MVCNGYSHAILCWASRENVLHYSACVCFAPKLMCDIAWSRVNVLCVAAYSHTQLRWVMIPDDFRFGGYVLRGL